MIEREYKDIKGYEGLYSISKDAYIRNAKGFVTNGWEHSKLGYRKVRLYKKGKYKDYYLHRLVAITFIPYEKGREIVNHKDCNPKNNKLDNLEWCTQKENMVHAVKNNRIKFKTSIVFDIVTKQVFNSVKEASELIGMKPNTLTCKLLGRVKNDTNFRFKTP